jgi:NADH-quinone oxidoreductase subunit L
MNFPFEQLLIAGVVIPLISFVLLALFGSKLGKPLAGYFACAALAASTVLAALVLYQWYGLDTVQRAALGEAAAAHSYLWAWAGDVALRLGVKLDSLTVIMFFMVTFVCFWIFVFSLGYMAHESDQIDGQSKYSRFFTFLCLFAFSMLGLVVSNSLLGLFIFWELVGICSYFLIGFYFHKRSASNAAIKAFVVNRVGDFGFMIGLMMVFAFLGELSIDGAAKVFAGAFNGTLAEGHLAYELLSAGPFGVSLATWMGICLFCGAIGKSAQFPLQVWLPDAMEGPTPVSALIHAATMVAAGVYLVARVFLLLTPQAQMVVAVIGCITLAMAALIAIVQTDIKRVLAYSTISQLGYMVFGMGVGAWIGALFHLLTHAFFKALLFLGSGQVIEGCHHEQDIRNMGGLRKKMPVTCWTFFIAVLAIAGAGVAGTKIGLGGFFSKDEILAVAYYRTHDVADHHEGEHASGLVATAHAATTHDEHGSAPAAEAGHDNGKKYPKILFWIPVITAYITAFYMMRCWWLTFMGKPRNQHVYEHAHESPLMYVPLIALAIGIFVSSYFWFRPMVAAAAPAGFLVQTFDGAHGPGMHAVHKALIPIVGFAFLIGFIPAILIYRRGFDVAERAVVALRPVHTLLVKKFYFDEIYGAAVVGVTLVVSSISRLFDLYVIDLIVNLSARITALIAWFSGWILDLWGIDGVANGLAKGSLQLAEAVRRPQTGKIRNYVMFAAGGAAAALVIAILIGT